jgi:predicted MPP superfamily phosphohydrolase
MMSALAAGCVGASGITEYSRWIEPQKLSIERREIVLGRLRPEMNGFTIALMSDFHYGTYIDRVLKSAVQAVNSAAPDVVLLAGDFITWHHDHGGHLADDADTCARILSGLQPGAGIMAVLGNHDYARRPEIVTEALRNHGIKVLNNGASAVEKNGARLWIAGVDDVLEGHPDLTAALQQVPRDEPTVLLAHEPDYADEVSRNHLVDLQLSGHSHGGQVRLPILGAPILPRLAEKYPMGSYRVKGMHLYTNRGLGMSAPRVRFNCPPELTLLTFRSEQRNNHESV